jgi:hypothetical protein
MYSLFNLLWIDFAELPEFGYCRLLQAERFRQAEYIVRPAFETPNWEAVEAASAFRFGAVS